MDDGPVGGAAPAKVVCADVVPANVEEPAVSKSPKKPKVTAAALEPVAKDTGDEICDKDGCEKPRKSGQNYCSPICARGGKAAAKAAAKGTAKGAATGTAKGAAKGVKKRPAGAMELKRKPAAAVNKGNTQVADDSGDVSGDEQEVDPECQKEEEAIVPKGARGSGVAQHAGGQDELALVPVAKHRDVMKSRNSHSLWRANNLPEEAKLIVDEMDAERAKGAW